MSINRRKEGLYVSEPNVNIFFAPNGIHVGPVVSITYHRLNEPAELIKLSAAMMDSNESLDDTAISMIAMNIGGNWREIFRLLGFTEGRLEHILTVYRGLEAVVSRLLLEWSQMDPCNNTFGRICTVLQQEGRLDITLDLEEYWMEKQSKIKDAAGDIN